MSRYSKYNIVYRLQKWMDSVPGQTFLNYAYSWGASIVILGTLFKLTHLPGANLMLFIGMGTEVLVFFLSAFDRPFDKTADGMDLQTQTQLEKEYADGDAEGEQQPAAGGEGYAGGVVAGPSAPGGTIIIGGGTGAVAEGEAAEGGAAGTGVAGGPVFVGGGGGGVVYGGGGGGAVYGGGEGPVGEGQPEGDAPAQGGAPVQGGFVGGTPAWVGQQQQVSPEMAEATTNYVEELNRLTEMLGKVSEQSARLTRDSEEMENLNRTLTGICKVYEMQLKGASQQIGTIDQINEQSRKMAQQIEQLNKIYARMIEAMTINMRTAAPAAPASDSNL